MSTLPAKRRFHYAYVVVSAGMLCIVGSLGIGRFGYNMLLPGMREGLRLSYTEMGLMVTGNFVAYMIAALLLGALAAKMGSRLVISTCTIFAGIVFFLVGFTMDFRYGLAMQILLGASTAGANIPAFSIASSWFAEKKRGAATGLVIGGIGLGIVGTGLLVPLLISLYGPEGWRYGWHYLGIVIVVIGIIGGIFLRDSPYQMGLAPVGSSETPTGIPSQRTRGSALAWGSVYRSKKVLRMCLTMSLYGFAYIIYATYFTTYLTKEGGLSIAEAGQLWALLGVWGMSGGFIGGFLSDRIGREKGMMVLLVVEAVAITLIALFRVMPVYYISLALYGITNWGATAVTAAAAGDYVGPRLAPAAMGMMSFVFAIGQALGPGIAGYIADTTGSFSPSFLISGLVMFLASFVAYTMTRMVRTQATEAVPVAD
ncbi:MAG: MFS transporter [Dehalococcoidia bacterium]|nr:MFS transporter [Dehalococcoidia bacterium]